MAIEGVQNSFIGCALYQNCSPLPHKNGNFDKKLPFVKSQVKCTTFRQKMYK